MKKFYLYILLTAMPFIQLGAQVIEVSVGEGYKNQAYVTLSSGEVATVSNESWDLAFSAFGNRDASIFVNESATFMKSPIQVYVSNTSWDEPITDTSVFVDSLVLLNSEKSWNDGALNSIKEESNPSDFGWGAYNPSNHVIEGSKVFVLKSRNGSYVKFRIESLKNATYTLHVADLDGGNAWTREISKEDGNGGFVYFSFDTKSQVSIPTDFDFVVQRYSTPITTNTGKIVDYMVTGILIAPGSQAVVIQDVDPKTVEESDYRDKYENRPDIIGYKWKSFDFNEGWSIDMNRTHFVKTKSGDVYQLTILDFQGAATGTTTMRIKKVENVSNTTNIEERSMYVYPNPAVAYVQVMNSQEQHMEFKIYDRIGKIHQKGRQSAKQKIDVSNLLPGIYYVEVRADAKTYTHKLIKI